MDAPSEKARALLGKDIEFSSEKRGKRTEFAGVVVGVERTYSRMVNERGNWPGVRYLIRCADGRRRWTGTFADEDAP